MTRMYYAPATGPDAISPAEFIRALKPQPSELEVTVGKLFTAAMSGDRETVRAIHEEMALRRKVEADLRATVKLQRKDAA